MEWCIACHRFYEKYSEEEKARPYGPGFAPYLCASCAKIYARDIEEPWKYLPELKQPLDDIIWASIKSLQAKLLSEGLSEAEVKRCVAKKARKWDEEYFAENEDCEGAYFAKNLAREIRYD